MVSQHVEVVSLDKVPEMPDGEVDSQEFPVNCTVPCLGRLQRLREEMGNH